MDNKHAPSVITQIMSDDPTAGPPGAASSLSTIQLKPQPINNIDNNSFVKLTTPPKSPKSNVTLNYNNSQFNNISNIDANTENVKTHSKNFAEATATNACPKLNKAIVFQAIDGQSKFTAPANIISTSRISKNRFCIFFNNQNTANELVKNHQKIVVNNEEITIRKLINPFKRITLSNVYPVIPDNTIIKALHEIGVRTTSAVFPLRTVSSSELFAHVTSFRRQIYINPEDHYKLPGSLVIKQEETSFHIFITDDTLTCFVCNQNGHIFSSCRYNTEINLETNKTT
ncbi:DNA replication licensing factor MCM4-like [Aphis craccivora]|uniref:DNA replication licensing factor MCM4-like n=1 Tax=Aphis craccivora TaxID=307492 RepID=A0A6G0YHE3_APHCR|nr:DNA replication licensing factor MCM4-like [Aphis craccivora]